MMRTIQYLSRALSCLLAAGVYAPASDADAGDGDRILSRIAFGSCANQRKAQPIWDAILDQSPDLFLFIGDNIYADTRRPDVMARKYAKLEAKPGFRALRAHCPVLATWDDHDYGENDAGRSYPMKHESKELFLDVFGTGPDDPRRDREGVYSAHRFGPPGRRVQVILLDTRWSRGPLDRAPIRPDGKGPYVPSGDETAPLLSEAQWAWLEAQLQKPADLRLLASSIQVLSDQHGWECWGMLPHERDRLFDLLNKTGAGGVLLLSGDRHLADLSRTDEAAPYPLYDLTSSSLNMPFRDPKSREPPEPNRHRVTGPYYGANFGMVLIDWNRKPSPGIALQIRTIQGEVQFDHTLPLSDLQPPPQNHSPHRQENGL